MIAWPLFNAAAIHANARFDPSVISKIFIILSEIVLRCSEGLFRCSSRFLPHEVLR